MKVIRNYNVVVNLDDTDDLIMTNRWLVRINNIVNLIKIGHWLLRPNRGINDKIEVEKVMENVAKVAVLVMWIEVLVEEVNTIDIDVKEAFVDNVVVNVDDTDEKVNLRIFIVIINNVTNLHVL